MRWSSATALAMYPPPAQMPTATTGRSRVRSSAASAVTAALMSRALPSGSSNWRGSPSLSPERPVVEGERGEAPLGQRPA